MINDKRHIDGAEQVKLSPTRCLELHRCVLEKAQLVEHFSRIKIQQTDYNHLDH